MEDTISPLNFSSLFKREVDVSHVTNKNTSGKIVLRNAHFFLWAE